MNSFRKFPVAQIGYPITTFFLRPITVLRIRNNCVWTAAWKRNAELIVTCVGLCFGRKANFIIIATSLPAGITASATCTSGQTMKKDGPRRRWSQLNTQRKRNVDGSQKLFCIDLWCKNLAAGMNECKYRKLGTVFFFLHYILFIYFWWDFRRTDDKELLCNVLTFGFILYSFQTLCG